MRHELVTMRQLIESANKQPQLVWDMMGVNDLVYDNERCFLQWAMGEGSHYDRVRLTYDESWDLYALDFFGRAADTHDTNTDTASADRPAADRQEVVQPQRNKMLTGVYVDDVIPNIEEHTGFMLHF